LQVREFLALAEAVANLVVGFFFVLLGLSLEEA
jgi:hypothetical protein